MSTWLGTLTRGGLLQDAHEEAGVAVAAYVVSEERLSELRTWMASQPTEVLRREQQAAIAVCMWMAHADRVVAPEERDLLRRIVLCSSLDPAERDELLRAVESPPSLADLEDRITHPVLRELLLALSWELAVSDERVTTEESALYSGLARRLGIGEARASEIRDSVVRELSD